MEFRWRCMNEKIDRGFCRKRVLAIIGRLPKLRLVDNRPSKFSYSGWAKSTVFPSLNGGQRSEKRLRASESLDLAQDWLRW